MKPQGGRKSAPLVIERRSYVNPFKTGDPCDMLGFREAQKMKINALRQSNFEKSLVERADLQKPTVPPLRAQKSNPNSKLSRSLSSMSSYIRKSKEREERCKRMTEFIQQKREMYIAQLLIDSKNEEIQRLGQTIKSKEQEFDDTENALTDTLAKCKTMTTEIEKSLSEGRKLAEQATQYRMELQRKLKKQVISIELEKSELSRNEDTLENYRLYDEFITQFNNDKLMSDPDNLISEFEKIEGENLFLIRECRKLEECYEKESSTVEMINQVSASINHIEELFAHRERTAFVPETPAPIDTEEVDGQIRSIGALVLRTYFNCFGAVPDLTPLAMLERIENTLEEFYKRMESVSPEFNREKQARFDKERREEMRKAMQVEKERLQQEKKEQAIARANKPIKERRGRPVVGRSQPMRRVSNDDARLLRQLAEQQKMENLLFGPALE